MVHRRRRRRLLPAMLWRKNAITVRVLGTHPALARARSTRPLGRLLAARRHCHHVAWQLTLYTHGIGATAPSAMLMELAKMADVGDDIQPSGTSPSSYKP